MHFAEHAFYRMCIAYTRLSFAMNNNKLAEHLEQLADLLEFRGENPFRLKAYRNGARVIRDLGESVASILLDPKRKLTDLDGIGKGVAEKCEVMIQTGHLPQLDEILEEIPRTVLDLLRIPHLGPKKAAALYHELNVTNLEQLKAACEAGEVRKLKGFAEKTEQAILDGLQIASAANERIYWSKADELVSELRTHLSKCKAIEQLEFAGSYRRGKETVGDLDILVVSKKPDEAMDALQAFPDVGETIGRGDTKLSVRLGNSFQVDMRVVPAESFGAALQYFTGSKEHNVIVRSRAKQLGLKINEWGVFRIDGDKETYIAGKAEADVYREIGLPCFAPEIREARDEFAWAEANALPELIELKDIRGDLHMHTTASDGKATIAEMIAAAQQRGLKYIAITDHSKRVSMANGLNEERLLEQWQEIDRINAELGKGFTLLKGIECDILEKGGMDLADEVLAQADWVLASIHYGQQQSESEITKRIIGAIEHPHVSVIAHPTGRLLNRREAYEVNMNEVLAAAKEHGKLMELNANPARLDLHEVHCAQAKALGIPIVINTDAHKIAGLDVMRFGIIQARRAGLEKADVANTRSWPQLKKLINRKSL
jgi:DNA polymerase (family 10)